MYKENMDPRDKANMQDSVNLIMGNGLCLELQ